MQNILIIAGSDSIGGAGIQADIKTCEAFGCFSSTAITAITAQNTNGVSAIVSVTPEFLNTQINMIKDELEIHAIKIGMLFDAQLIEVVKKFIFGLKIPIVIDPVCVAKSGAKLLEQNALNGLRELLKMATLATPNIDETKILGLYKDIKNQDLPCDILLKRTNLGQNCEDTLYLKNKNIIKFNEPLIEPKIMHGAGCSFSSAIACGLANKKSLEVAINEAKKFVFNAIKNAHDSKFGKRLLNHKRGICG